MDISITIIKTNERMDESLKEKFSDSMTSILNDFQWFSYISASFWRRMRGECVENGPTDGWTDRWTGRWTDWPMDWLMDGLTDRLADGWTDGWTDGWMMLGASHKKRGCSHYRKFVCLCARNAFAKKNGARTHKNQRYRIPINSLTIVHTYLHTSTHLLIHPSVHPSNHLSIRCQLIKT